MRIAVLSDIHSNLQALNKALSFIEGAEVNEIYCLGDIVGYGGNPNECVELIRRRAVKVVMGNHDVAAVNPKKADYFTKPGKIAAQWTNEVLSKENLDYLAGLPLIDNTPRCTLVHAGPSSPESWEYVLSIPIAEKQFSHFTTDICFIGHSHIPAICGEDLATFSFKTGQRFLINVGSLGQPRDGNPRLSFGLLDTEQWSYHNIRLEYDVDGAAGQIQEVGLPAILGKRLFQGV
jgi:predicted phosphodiesterase